MRKVIVLALLLTSCIRSEPQMSEGEEQEHRESKVDQSIKADIKIDYDPHKQPAIRNRPPVSMSLMGENIVVPPNSTVTATFKSDRDNSQSEWFDYIGKFKASKKMASLLIGGSICLAGGTLLCLYGAWNLGIAVAGFGLVLLTCGVVIEKYPWLFIIILILGAAAGCYVIYFMLDKHKQQTALSELIDKIDLLKRTDPDAARKVTEELAKSRHAKTVRKHVGRLRD